MGKKREHEVLRRNERDSGGLGRQRVDMVEINCIHYNPKNK